MSHRSEPDGDERNEQTLAFSFFIQFRENRGRHNEINIPEVIEIFNQFNFD